MAEDVSPPPRPRLPGLLWLPLGLAGLWAAETLGAPRFPLLTLAASLPHLPLALVPAAAAMLALRRRRGRDGIMHLAALAAVLLWAGWNVPLHRSGGHGLRVATFNIHGLALGAEAVRSALEEARPDVICLQEAYRWNLEEDVYPGGRAGWFTASVGELAILSRQPLEDVKEVELADPARMTRPALVARTGGVTFVNLHWSLLYHPGWGVGELEERVRTTSRVRDGQADRLLRLLPSLPGPVVMAGDLNATPRDPAVRRILRQGVDAFGAAGWGFGYTFAADLPVVRIDYVLAPPGSEVVEARVVSRPASDHRALVAEVVPSR